MCVCVCEGEGGGEREGGERWQTIFHHFCDYRKHQCTYECYYIGVHTPNMYIYTHGHTHTSMHTES